MNEFQGAVVVFASTWGAIGIWTAVFNLIAIRKALTKQPSG